jgi:hypothetical protein
MWCSPNPRNDFAEIILAYASSSGGAFPSKRQWQKPPSSAIKVEVTSTDYHRLPFRRYDGIPFGQPQNHKYPIFKLCLPAIFIVLPCTEKSNSVFCDFRKRALLRHSRMRPMGGPLRFSLAVRGIPPAAEWNHLLKENRLPLPFYSPAAVFQTKGGLAASGYGSFFRYPGRDPANFSEVTTVTISQRL